MPFDFPASPSNGQQFTPPGGGPTYVFNNPIWKVKADPDAGITEAPVDGKQYGREDATWTEIEAGGGAAATYIGDTPPPAPVPGQLWWESDTGFTYIWYDDGNTQQWVAISAIGATTPLTDAPADSKSYGRKDGNWNEVLPIAGGTLTGDLAINPGKLTVKGSGTGHGIIYSDTVGAGKNSGIWFNEQGVNRWALYKYGNAEAGADAGSDLRIDRVSDAGAATNALTIERKTGNTTLTGDVIVSKASPTLTLNDPAPGGTTDFRIQVGGKTRWSLNKGTALETGANVGSNLNLVAYDDAGNPLFTPLQFTRSSGLITINQGLAFGALSSAANALDYYGEGAWVPTVNFNGNAVGLTYGAQQGRYTRVGNIVTWWCRIVMTAKGTSTGAMFISGLPFNAAANMSFYSSGGPFFAAMTSVASLALLVSAGESRIQPYHASVGSQLTDANVTATTYIIATGQYEAA